jgi:predicted ATPase
VTDIGVLGEEIAPFLYRLRGDKKKHYDAIRRTLRAVVPSVEDLDIDLDKNRGILDIRLQQEGISYSSRVISEGTLRVLALCAIAVNPWPPSVVAFEEPENGVHPRRLELIAELLLSVATQPGRQVVVTTHSPLFCEAVLKRARNKEEIALLSVRSEGGATRIHPFSPSGPLFEDDELRDRLSAPAEDGLFSGLILRGLLDE